MDFSAYEKGNPFMSYNHIQICKVDPDCCVVKVNLVAESMNLHGHVHGGLLYAMADCVAGIFARMDGRDYVTQSAHINFLHNVQSGTIFAKAEIIKRGTWLTFISALPIKMIIFFVMVWLICIVFQDAKHSQASAILRIHT